MAIIASAGFANGVHYFFQVESPDQVSVTIQSGNGLPPLQTTTETVKGAVEWIQRQTCLKGLESSEDY